MMEVQCTTPFSTRPNLFHITATEIALGAVTVASCAALLILTLTCCCCCKVVAVGVEGAGEPCFAAPSMPSSSYLLLLILGTCG